jgi:hypothetical protein
MTNGVRIKQAAQALEDLTNGSDDDVAENLPTDPEGLMQFTAMGVVHLIKARRQSTSKIEANASGIRRNQQSIGGLGMALGAVVFGLGFLHPEAEVVSWAGNISGVVVVIFSAWLVLSGRGGKD